MTSYTLLIEHLTGGTTDVTNNFIELELILQGTGKVKSGRLVLNARRGKFINVAPVIDEFHKFRITLTDDQSPANIITEVMEVDTYLPIKNAQEGYRLECQLLGQEHWIAKVDFGKQFYFENAFIGIRDIHDIYNSQISGLTNVTVENHDSSSSGNNELPKWTANNYEFNISPKKCYKGAVEIISQLGTAIGSGGAADFFELYYEPKTADDTTILLKAFSSGSKPTAGNEVTISDSTSVNEAPTEGIIDATTGTLVKVIGAELFGTLPPENSQFAGELEAFKLHPKFVSLSPDDSWPVGSYVQSGQDAANLSTHFQANVATNQTPPGTDWDDVTFSTFVSVSNYSLWTKNKVDEHKSNGSDPSNTEKGIGCWDSNTLIEDGTHFQSEVTFKATNPTSIPVQYLYGATAGNYFRGLTILVNGTGAGDFLGNDLNGVAFTNNVVQFRTFQDGTKAWLVIRITSDNERCAVNHEGKVYELQTSTWTDVSGTARENHCYHIAQSITNVAGVSGIGTFGTNSAVEWNWQYTALDTIPAAFFTSDGFYKIGAWANIFRAPFPNNSYNSNTLGELWGNNATKFEPATLDTNNLKFTHSGLDGFNNDEAEDYLPLSGVRFWNKFKWTDVNGNTLQGNFKMRAFMYDSRQNVVVQDYTIGINDLWENIYLPFTGFEPYRARIPLSLRNIAANLFTEQLDIQNVFWFRDIQRIGIQWQEVYDSEGRFAPEGSRAITGAFAGTANIRLAVDGFEFAKPLFSVTPKVTSGPLVEPEPLQQPNVTNKFQLDQIATSQLQIEKFRYRAYEITTPLRLDIPYGDTFFLNDSLLVNDADTRTADSGGIANTIRLVNKRTKISITKPATGPGHALRTILGVKRIIT